MQSQILAELGASTDIRSPEVRNRVEELFSAKLTAESVVLTRVDRMRLLESIQAEIMGFGPIDALLKDESIIEIMVNGPQSIYINQKGRLIRTNIAFENEKHVLRILNRILEPLNQTADAVHPTIDVRLPDYSHLYAVLPPIARNGPTITIRKFSKKPLTAEDLIRFGSMPAEVADFLRACVMARLNIVVSGSVGSGKTALLNVLANFIPNDERIFVIEEEYELQLHQEHVIYWNSRPSNLVTHGETNTGELIAQAQGMTPDRIVIGECRGGEARDIVQAMHVGYDGLLMTMYSENPRDTLSRLEAMFLTSGTKVSTTAIRSQIASTVNLIVHVERLRDGSRKVTKVTEVQGIEGDSITTAEIFEFELSAFEGGRAIGRMRPTGLRPKFLDRIEAASIHLPPSVFGIAAGTNGPSPSSNSEISTSRFPENSVEEPQSEVPVVEDVHFTMFHPKEATADKWYAALLYAHVATALEAVQKDAKKFDDEMTQDVRELHGKKVAKLARGTELQFALEAEGIEFKPNALTLRWDEDLERASFRFRASSELIGQPAFGEASIYVGPVQVASIRFSIFITDSATAGDTKAEQISTQADLYQNVFISYSHRDTTIVEACTRAFRAIGYEVLVDYEKLRSGEEWNDALQKIIDQADIFQLFWSQNSASSKYVAQEWQYALANNQGTGAGKGTGFIRPVYWEQPMPDVPSELAHLHFKYLPSLADVSNRAGAE